MAVIFGIKFQLMICLGILLIVERTDAIKCVRDMSEWFLPFGESHGDQVELPKNRQIFRISQPFNAMGVNYNDGFQINMRGGASAGSFRVYPNSGWKSPGSFEVRASRARYDETRLGVANMRVTEHSNDTAKIARLVNEAYPCLENGPFHPDTAFVVTFTCMKKQELKRDTFQAILAVNGQKTYLILNYHLLHSSESHQYALRDVMRNKKFLFTNVARDQMARNLLHVTNGIRRGVWIFDITDTVPKRPEHCPKENNECTMTNRGSIHSFNGDFDVLPYDGTELMTQSLFSPKNECSIYSWIRMTDQGEIRYVDIWVGKYNPDRPRSMVQFDMDRKPGHVRQRRGGHRHAVSLELPYSWTQESNTVMISNTTNGWIIESQFCGFKLEYRRFDAEPKYRLTLGQTYDGNVSGYCGYFGPVYKG